MLMLDNERVRIEMVFFDELENEVEVTVQGATIQLFAMRNSRGHPIAIPAASFNMDGRLNSATLRNRSVVPLNDWLIREAWNVIKATRRSCKAGEKIYAYILRRRDDPMVVGFLCDTSPMNRVMREVQHVG